MSEKCFNQVGLKIASEFARLVGPDGSPQDLAELISNTDNHNFIVQSIYAGFDNSDPVIEYENLLEEILAIEQKMRGLLPSSSYLFNASAFFIRRAVEGCYSVKNVLGIFQNEEILKSLSNEIVQCKTMTMALAALGTWISGVPIVYVKNFGQKNFNSARTIVDILMGKLAGFTDEEFVAFSRKDRALPLDTAKIDAETSALNDLSYMTQLTRSLFTVSEYDRISDSVTRLKAAFDK